MPYFIYSKTCFCLHFNISEINWWHVVCHGYCCCYQFLGDTYFLFTWCKIVGWLWLHWPLLWLIWLGLAYLYTATHVLESWRKDKTQSETILPPSHDVGREQMLNLTSQAHWKLPGYGLYMSTLIQLAKASHVSNLTMEGEMLLHPPRAWVEAVGAEIGNNNTI